jgi:hypothetical protein
LFWNDELVDAVLQGCFISDATISSGAAARRALSDDGREQRYLKTAHGRGFRFDGWLVAVEPTTSKESEAQGLRQQIRNCPHRGRHPIAYAIAGCGQGGARGSQRRFGWWKSASRASFSR